MAEPEHSTETAGSSFEHRHFERRTHGGTMTSVMGDKNLTLKQQRFVDEYLIDLNATQAAIRSGYSAKTAGSIGDENLKKPEIASAINNAFSDRSSRAGLTQEFVINGLRENLARAMQQTPVLDREGNPTGEYRYQGNVANKALELLGKHLGMFVDRNEHTGTTTIIQTIIGVAQTEIIGGVPLPSPHPAPSVPPVLPPASGGYDPR